MRLHRLKTLFIVFVIFISSCDIQPHDAPISVIPSVTPFQPLTENVPDSPYTGAAPTPLNLPTFTPLPPTPTERVILPEILPAGVNVPAFTLPKDLNPLTGLPPSDPALMERRPLAIKVANYPRYNRPQYGLTLADNIYEYYIEGGLTRFIAVFYGNNSEWVGPVRSGRYFDENIQRMYQAFLVFKFADPRVLDAGRDSVLIYAADRVANMRDWRTLPAERREACATRLGTTLGVERVAVVILASAHATSSTASGSGWSPASSRIARRVLSM